MILLHVIIHVKFPLINLSPSILTLCLIYVCVSLQLNSLQSGTPLDQARSKPPLDLTEENVKLALEEAKETLGTIFGNSAENRNIGITGDVQVRSPCMLTIVVYV